MCIDKKLKTTDAINSTGIRQGDSLIPRTFNIVLNEVMKQIKINVSSLKQGI